MGCSSRDPVDTGVVSNLITSFYATYLRMNGRSEVRVEEPETSSIIQVPEDRCPIQRNVVGDIGRDINNDQGPSIFFLMNLHNYIDKEKEKIR